jgi:hypothetical protein
LLAGHSYESSSLLYGTYILLNKARIIVGISCVPRAFRLEQRYREFLPANSNKEFDAPRFVASFSDEDYKVCIGVAQLP